MSDEEVAFDDWQAEAQAVVEEVKNEQPSEPQPEQQDSPQNEEPPKQKVETIDPKQALLARIARYSVLTDEKFEDYLQQTKASSTNTESKSSTQILKSDKDFAQFARSVGKRLNDQAAEEEGEALDEGNLFNFVDELFMLMYSRTEWKNLENVKDKLKIVKRERKDEEVKAKKKQQKEERDKKQQKLEQEQEEAKKAKKKEEPQQEQDDIFGGATFVNSKQLEEERKNKEKPKVEAPPKPAQDDDDDFM